MNFHLGLRINGREVSCRLVGPGFQCIVEPINYYNLIMYCNCQYDRSILMSSGWKASTRLGNPDYQRIVAPGIIIIIIIIITLSPYARKGRVTDRTQRFPRFYLRQGGSMPTHHREKLM